MRKIIFRAWMLLLAAFCCTFFTVSAAGASGTKDDLVQAYIREIVPEGSALIDSSCRTSYQEITGKGQTGMNDRIQADVYTYCWIDDGKTMYRSVVVLELLEKIRITENDLLEVSLNDYLYNYSPEDGRMYTRSSSADAWSGMREITPMPESLALNTVAVYGSEMKSGSEYALILLSFPSDENPDPVGTAPEYQITFTHDAQIYIPLWCVALAAVLVLIAAGVILWKKRRNL